MVYIDPAGDDFGLSILIGAAIGAAINGSLTAAQGGNFLDGAWKGAITGAIGGGIGAITGGTFAANLALGTAEGAITGGVGSVLNGGNFWEGAKWGALTGAALTTVSSENFGNMLKGEGFNTNSRVFGNMIDRGVSKQGILDYFGMDAAYDATMDRAAKFWYNTDGSDCGIKFGDSAFDSFGTLKENYLKESFHMKRYLKGQIERYDSGLGMSSVDLLPEEHAGAIYEYRNQGLYHRSPTPHYQIIGNIQNQMKLFEVPHSTYNKRWWHFVYKLPRRY